MDYNSNYEGQEVADLLDKAKELNVVAVEIGEVVDDVILEYATKGYVDTAIIGAINSSY